jgi:hypothetical protein
MIIATGFLANSATFLPPLAIRLIDVDPNR